MLTYQVRERVYRQSEGQKLTFPNDVELVFFFQPLQPFGKEPGGGRTAVGAVEATVYFDANTGHHTITSRTPLNPLEVVIEEPVRSVRLTGNELRIKTRCNAPNDLDELIQSIFFGFPMLLNVQFADPPVVEGVTGQVGSTPFRWELDNWRMEFYTTTQELQEQRVALAWEGFNILSAPGNRRLIAALHYFHVACRLCRAGNSPWEFMSETILNLSKVLEVLFPPAAGDGRTLDAVRDGLSKLGFSEKQIEASFIPAMCLRNQIDSAHVDLSIFTRDQLRTLHAYTDSAETAFRLMLQRLVEKIKSGELSVPQYSITGARAEAVTIIEKIAERCVHIRP